MYLGVRAHRDAAPVASYADAQRVLEAASRTPTGKRRTAKPDGFPLGGHSKSVCWVREDDDQSIAFMLYSTDVVTWYPDNSVVIDNYGTVTTSGFASRFLPRGIYLQHPTNRRGHEAGYRTITYWTAEGRYICNGGLVCFREHGDLWLPDEDTLDPIKLVDTDPREVRTVLKRYPLKEFDNWLAMAPMHLDVEHDHYNQPLCLDALLERDFRTAARYLPLINASSAWGVEPRTYEVKTKRWGERVGPRSVELLRIGIMEEEGLFTTIPHLTLSCANYERGMKRVRELRRIGAGWDLGPRR